MTRSRGTPVSRQFFAGTACPSCGVVDQVRRCEDAAGTIWLECVACGYTQDLTEGYVARDEMEAGSNRTPQPVRFIPRPRAD